MGDSLILVGRVAGAFGVRGEVRITSFTADPLALLDYRELKREDGSPGLTLLSGRPAKGARGGGAHPVEPVAPVPHHPARGRSRRSRPPQRRRDRLVQTRAQKGGDHLHQLLAAIADALSVE